MVIRKYQVIGSFEGKRINEIVMASSKKQAKLKGIMSAGIYGFYTRKAMKSRNIKVRMVK